MTRDDDAAILAVLEEFGLERYWHWEPLVRMAGALVTSRRPVGDERVKAEWHYPIRCECGNPICLVCGVCGDTWPCKEAA